MIFQKENIKEYNSKWTQTPDYANRILIIIRGSGSGKTNALLSLLNHQPDINFIYTQKIHMKQNCNS